MRLFAAVFAFVMLAAGPGLAAPKFPALTGRVVDGANILSGATRSDLDGKLAALEAKTSRQLVVVTVPSLQGYEISDFGYQLGRAWGIGQAKLNNGVLLLVAPTEHKVRVEVGYGLEPILTDAFSEILLQTLVLPKFRQGDYNGGVEAGVDALIQQLSRDPSAAEAKIAEVEAADRSGGGSSSHSIVPFIFGLIVFFFIFGRLFGSRFRGGLWPLLLLSSMNSGRSSGSGDWGGGSFGGGSFGGGFSGGGGSFGGGGASGGW